METPLLQRVNLHAKGLRELGTLQDAFNAMLARINEHRIAREEAEEKYQSIYQNAVEGIFQSTPKGQFVDANPALARILGYDSPEDLISSINDLQHQVYVHAEDRIRFMERLRKGENVTDFEAQTYRKDGSVVWTALNARPIFNAAGELVLIEGMSADVTERKKAESAMKLAVEAAEEASRMKSNFISMVTHELRTPLTSVMGFAKMITKKLAADILPKLPEDDPACQKAARQVVDNLSVIVHESKRLSNLISEVLDLSRMESGNMKLHITKVDLSQALDRAFSSVGFLLEEKGLTCTKNVAPDMPLVEADEDRIVQVCINLLANAVKFTHEGGITCRLEHTATEVRVNVQDTGAGISAEDQKEIFNKFKQLGDTLTDRPQGTGLGLAISKEIVEQHGGRIYVESAPGQGSTFVFTLPLRQKKV